MSIVLQGSTSGSITLQEPAVAGSTVLSLPARTSTILGDDGAGKVRKADMPSGSVLQVVYGSSASSFTTTSGTLAATGLQAIITPTSATSKVLILTANSVYIKQTSSDYGCGVGIARNGSVIFSDSNGFNNFYFSWPSGGYNFRNRTPFNYLDSPASTSALTYALYLSAYNGEARLSTDSQPSTIILMEIAA